MYNDLLAKKAKLAVVGLGYVGMPLAVAFAKKIDVIGFDVNKKKVEKYLSGIDVTNEVGNDEIKNTKMQFTCDEKQIANAKFIIIAVPTPISLDKTPDLSPVEGASEIVGRNLTKGSIVVYESTVYPGVTEDVCVPILEKHSGLKCGVDFKIGYSPERINPADKVHRLENIKKIVSGMDAESLQTISQVYDMIVEVGTYKAESIKVAEAAKVVENSQRDINIAFMNELAMAFDKMGINTMQVVNAMNTKWNALGFTPGLVGGHCIGVDPYYFIYKAEQLGYHSQIIAASRRINDDMGKFISDCSVKKMIEAGMKVKDAKVAVFGITFKENCPDPRNSKVEDIIKGLREYGVDLKVVDPIADEEDVLEHYGVKLCKQSDLKDLDCIIMAVKHEEFLQMGLKNIDKLFGENGKVLIDVKSMFNENECEQLGMLYWSL